MSVFRHIGALKHNLFYLKVNEKIVSMSDISNKKTAEAETILGVHTLYTYWLNYLSNGPLFHGLVDYPAIEP
jgi:hypothetical protein